MNTSGDAADRIVQLSLEGFEVMVRLSGAGAKEVIAMIYSVLKDNQKNSIGKTNLLNMMKTCKEIKIFTMKKSDLERFSEEAKKYGILYCVLMDKDSKSKDGMVDLMVRGEDAPKVDRIVERYNLSISDPATLRDIQVKEKEEQKEKLEIEEEISKGNENEIDDIMNSIAEINENEIEQIEERDSDGVSNDFFEIENQLETSLESKGETEDGRISVKEELKKNNEKIKKTENEASKKEERAEKEKPKKKERIKKEKSKKKKGAKKHGRDR